RETLWAEQIKNVINWELHDRGIEAYTWFVIEELARTARGQGLTNGAPRGAETERLATEAIRAQLGKSHDRAAFEPFASLREDLIKPFRASVFFWPRKGGKTGDLVADEMNRVMQVPGWSNIFTMPIINRIDMLSTGVRTDIGIKVFGPDLV